MPNHDEIQTALSARIDGEDPGISDDILDAHLAVCEKCQQFHHQAVALSRSLAVPESVSSGMAPPQQLSEVILAGVEPTWRRSARKAQLRTILARMTLAVLGVGFVLWAIVLIVQSGGLSAQTLDDRGGIVLDPSAEPELAYLLVEAAAFRFGLALGLIAVAWKPQWALGLFPVVATTAMFLLGFTVRDLVLSQVSAGRVVFLVALFISLFALGWLWQRFRAVTSSWAAT